MINEEDVKRFAEAKNCEDCLGWHKHCKAECCKIISLGIDPEILNKNESSYIVLKLKNPLSPSDQYYYRLRDVRYTRGTLRFQKDRIHVIGRKVFYIHQCKFLDKNNLCEIHSTSKPQLCRALTLETAHEKNNGFIITDNCLFKYKVKGGFDDGGRKEKE